MKLSESLKMFIMTIQARDFSTKKRKKLAKSGAAMPDGSFPIQNKGDLTNAEHMVGLSKHPAAAKRHVKERARALGLSAEEMARDKKRYKAGVHALSKEITRRKTKMAAWSYNSMGDNPSSDPE